jgi:hypothetical protein
VQLWASVTRTGAIIPRHYDTQALEAELPLDALLRLRAEAELAAERATWAPGELHRVLPLPASAAAGHNFKHSKLVLQRRSWLRRTLHARLCTACEHVLTSDGPDVAVLMSVPRRIG